MQALALKPILQEAWQKVKGAKTAFFGVALALAFVQLVFFLPKHFLENNFPDHATAINFLFTFLCMFTVSPIFTGLSMLGVKRARGETPTVKQGLQYFPKILNLFATQLLYSLTLFCFFCILLWLGLGIAIFALHGSKILFCIFLGFWALLFITVFLTLYGIFSFAFILVADQNKSPWQAYKTCIKIGLAYYKTLFLVQLVWILAAGLGTVLFGIGLLWAIPFGYIMTGLLYQKIFIHART